MKSSALSIAIEVYGQVLWLLPEHAVWWPASRTLFVADLHLGKAACFRALGQPVPAGTTRDNLDRLSFLVRMHEALRVVFLGDLLHAAEAQQVRVLEPLRQWREEHAAVACVLVRGNHDLHAGDPPPSVRFEVVDEPWQLSAGQALLACHHPRRIDGKFVLAGHRHPTVTLRGRGRDEQRLPCFCHSDGLLVLPAFGAFTGGSSEGLPADARGYAVGGGRVWALPR